MTIRVKADEVPTELPPARLYLDDVEEIVRVLKQACSRNHESDARQAGADGSLSLTLQVGRKVCDEVSELPKIARKTTNLSIEVREGQRWSNRATVDLSRYATRITTYGFTRGEHFEVFGHLLVVFRARRHPWNALVHYGFGFSILVASVALQVALPILAVRPFQNRALLPNLAVGMALIAVALAIAAALFHHSVVILRPSSEPSSFRQDIGPKIIVAAVSSIIGAGLTLLTMYLKHKYWP
jgi:hypothetical protein